MSENIYEKYRLRLEQLCLMDDGFMTAVFEDSPECIELVLRIILGKKLTVIEARTQLSLKNVRGRSVRLDIFAKDDNNKVYNIEVQRDDRGAIPHRARYNSSLLDVNLLGQGDDFDALPQTYVIFITERDVLQSGKPLYTVERTVRETQRPFNDGSTIIYVNASYQDDSALGRLMHDFSCTKPERMHYKELRERTSYFKTDEKGARKMGSIFDEIREEGIHEGVAKGKEEGKQEGILEKAVSVAKKLFPVGMSIEQVAEITNLPIEQLRQIQAAM